MEYLYYLKALIAAFGPKVALGILILLVSGAAIRKSVAFFATEAVRLLSDWVRAQTEEKRALLQQNQKYSADIQQFLHNHLSHMEQERQEHRQDMAKRDAVMAEMGKTQVRIATVLDEVLNEVQAHRTEDQRRAEN